VVLLLVAIAVTAVKVSNNANWIRSNVFELLPASDHDPLRESATSIVDAELGTRLLFFVGHKDLTVAKSTAETLGTVLSSNPLLATVDVRVDASQYSDMVGFYYQYRLKMLSDAQLERIVIDPEGIEADAVAKLYSPFGGGGGNLATDPFFLFADSMQALQPGSALTFDDGYLLAEKDGLDYVFVMAKLVSPTLSIVEQESLARHINEALVDIEANEPNLEILKTGFSFYAHEATQSAKGEISTIGVGSLIGLLLLVVSTFRSLRPLSLIVVSIAAGCVIALAFTLSIFGFVHLFTLVFGASLIGVSVDYSFHYIADDAFGGEDWTPQRGLNNIFMGITLGLATSILAYLALTVAPFPGLQQLAVFSSAGLIGAWITLFAMTRLIRRRFVMHDRSMALRFASGFLGIWQRHIARHQLIFLGVLAVIIIAAWQTVDVNDDVRMLQSQPPQLVAQEEAIQELLGVAQAGTFLLLSATDEQSLLEQEEMVRVSLDELIEKGSLDSYQAVSRWVPSQSRQARSQQAYTGLLESRLLAWFAEIEVDQEDASAALAELIQDTPSLDVTTWLQHPASEQFRHLWLDTGGNGVASMVLLFGVDDIDVLPDVTVVNKGRELSALFGEYRSRVAQVLIAAYLVILLGLATRYGLKRAAILMVPPVFAGLLALTLISLAGETLNLFHFLALILVLGIGIDFTLFVAEAKHELTSTLFAITLSALTTMLSFGLLSLSSTFAVHSFGLTVLIGIAFAYLLSPVAIGARAKSIST
jgi:predicted exporter